MPFKQSFESIHRQLRRDGALFEDPEFEANDHNMFHSRKPPRPFIWKRPGEIVQDPHLFVDGASRLDIDQGMLGDCWLLAAMASLAQHETLLHRVMPPDYGFSGEYAGIFRINLWYFGEWRQVVIDDRLPTYDNRLVFAHSKEKNEFWAPLLEKAYAKLHGSYEALKGGQTSEAMEDFTGGLSETYPLKAKTPANLFQIIQKAFERQSLMGCSLNAKPNQIEAKLDNGLVMGQAYTVTCARKVSARTRGGDVEVELIRVRNPSGNEREWKGAWGDKSAEWLYLSDDEKRQIGLTFEDDGEFWMSFRDWSANFDRIEICHLDDGVNNGEMEMQFHNEVWRIGSTAGGCRNNPNTFHRNPQIRFDVEEGEEEGATSSVVIALMQKDRRKLKEMGKGMLTIGFAIYKLEEADLKMSRLTKDYFLYNESTARSTTFINSREITDRFEFAPGHYCIVPSTFDANEDGEFILRLYTPKQNKSSDTEEVSSIERPTKPKITPEQSAAMDSKYLSFFQKVAGNDDLIDAFELQRVLSAAISKELAGRDVSISLSRLLVRAFDHELTGKLNFQDFREMLIEFQSYMAIFKKHDTNRSGDMDIYELQDAFGSLGFKLSDRALSPIATYYANKTGRISADDFIEAALKAKLMYETYVSFQGRQLTLDELICTAF